MESALALEELERYECFGVPPHVWTAPQELAALVVRPRVAPRAVAPDLELLGIEAIPSPALDRPFLHG